MDAKSIFRSKTFWFNILMGVLEVLRTNGVVDVIPQEVIASTTGLGNIVIRFLTNQPVKLV